MSQRRHLLVCFDAFGTIFSPKIPVHKQYIEEAKRLKLNLSYDGKQVLTKRLYDTIKSMRKDLPNYGKNAGLTPRDWWFTLIRRVFDYDGFWRGIGGQPRRDSKSKQMSTLIDRLYTRFSTDEAYSVHQDAHQLLSQICKIPQSDLLAPDSKLILGIVTNSDPRVTQVLQCLGCRIKGHQSSNPGEKVLRFDHPVAEMENLDIPQPDFILTSHEAGVEKPDTAIFDQAEQLCRKHLPRDFQQDPIVKLYIGDDVTKDGESANRAGWHAIIVQRPADDLPKQVKDKTELPALSASSLTETLSQILSSTIGNSQPPILRLVSSLSPTSDQRVEILLNCGSRRCAKNDKLIQGCGSVLNVMRTRSDKGPGGFAHSTLKSERSEWIDKLLSKPRIV